MSKEDIKGHGLTPIQVKRAKTLYPKLKSQDKVAQALKVAKWKINLLFKSEKISRKQPTALKEFNQDVLHEMKIRGWGKKEATRQVKTSFHWLKRYKTRTGKDRAIPEDILTPRRDRIKEFWDRQRSKLDPKKPKNKKKGWVRPPQEEIDEAGY